MNSIRKKEATFLFVGDIVVLFVSLYFTISLRYNALPTKDLLLSHLVPFSFLFAVSVLIHFISGLYEKHTRLLKRRLPIILFQVQIVNTIVSIAFFYFVPYFNISPKIFLFIYLIISLVFMVAWRMSIAEPFRKKRKNKALLLAHGREIQELYDEMNDNSRYGTVFVRWIDIEKEEIKGAEIIDFIKSQGISFVVADFNDPKINQIMPVLYNCIFSGVQFIDAGKMYEEIFDRIPLSLLDDSWFIENVSTYAKISFDLFKRLMDIVTSLIGGIISLIFYPFIYLAIKINDKGVIFSYQNRVGQNNKMVRLIKFRTMTVANDNARWSGEKNTVTKVGNFLRKSRLDELPQLWNVLKGDISLVGPRPEFSDPVAKYSKEIPYYNVRHIVKPGLFGWAQIYGLHPHHGIDMEQTSNKLSYDLYYIKNRSIILDLKIAIQTIKVIFSFVGR